MRRGRDERNGADARLDGDNQYVSFMPGEQADEGNDSEPVDELESSFDLVEGAAISEGEDPDAVTTNDDGSSSYDLVEDAEISDNPDPAAADVAESEIRARPEGDTPAWVSGGPLYDDEFVNTSGESSADHVDDDTDAGEGASDDSDDSDDAEA